MVICTYAQLGLKNVSDKIAGKIMLTGAIIYNDKESMPFYMLSSWFGVLVGLSPGHKVYQLCRVST